MSYEEPTGPRGRRGNRGPRRSRGGDATFPLRNREVCPPRRRPPLTDGEGPRPVPEPRVHFEPCGPLRGRPDSGHGRSRGGERDPLLPDLVGRVAARQGAHRGLGQRLTHARVGGGFGPHRPRGGRSGVHGPPRAPAGRGRGRNDSRLPSTGDSGETGPEFVPDEHGPVCKGAPPAEGPVVSPRVRPITRAPTRNRHTHGCFREFSVSG